MILAKKEKKETKELSSLKKKTLNKYPNCLTYQIKIILELGIYAIKK